LQQDIAAHAGPGKRSRPLTVQLKSGGTLEFKIAPFGTLMAIIHGDIEEDSDDEVGCSLNLDAVSTLTRAVQSIHVDDCRGDVYIDDLQAMTGRNEC
jgi:hypothetical protein